MALSSFVKMKSKLDLLIGDLSTIETQYKSYQHLVGTLKALSFKKWFDDELTDIHYNGGFFIKRHAKEKALSDYILTMTKLTKPTSTSKNLEEIETSFLDLKKAKKKVETTLQ